MTKHQAPSTKHHLSRYWLLLGVSALAIAGLFALVLVAARSPDVSSPLMDAWFHKSLVVHVDLSVLVWFLSIACLMWSLSAQGSRPIFPFLEEAALICFALGTLFIAVSPLDPRGVALMSNYIPVITSPVFFLGLALLLCGVGLMLVRCFAARCQTLDVRGQKEDSSNIWPLTSGVWRVSAPIALISILAFIWSYRRMPRGLDAEQYYDTLFWGGGHVLQLLHVQIVMIVWLMLARQMPDVRWQMSERILYPLFSIGLIAAFATPVPYLLYSVDSYEHRQFFTQLMVIAGGAAPAILALWLIPLCVRTYARKNALWSALAMSILLFLYGGILGGMIHGQNVVIPAHYHGAIVGVTLAFMGAAYMFLPQFGWRDVANWRPAFWQPIVYGGGQFLHITGLAISGGYGVLRKTPGGLEGVSTSVKAAMGIMGVGGLLAIIGGFMFVVVIAKAIFTRADVPRARLSA